jgi:3-oxoacyl-(acyl-carrier-protein) synthase
MGVISALADGVAQTAAALHKGMTGLRPLTLFSTAPNPVLPVGEVPLATQSDALPRTHRLAYLAAEQVMAQSGQGPDAVVLGITTGGMSSVENLLQCKTAASVRFRFQSIGSVAEEIARRYRCLGPVITVSTACSSGAVALKIALEMLRAGLAKRVLAGGADSLCRLTYHGFKSLQLIDPEGARPLDQNRQGMSVAEGAAMLLLVADDPRNAVAEIIGAGLACDAYHPSSPHPQGKGALAAMQAAICDAGIAISDIDYINLHGTGTRDNDLAEAMAIHALFPVQKPLLSSVKGAFGHSLAAAGTIEALVSALTIANNRVPANIGCRVPDPALGLTPVMQPTKAKIDCVLSNSFGFGGNNAALIIAAPGKFAGHRPVAPLGPLAILGSACVTGAGNTATTMQMVSQGRACKGMLSLQEISANLPHRAVRRLKRLPRLALSLAIAAQQHSGERAAPSMVFLGTGWGALSETYDFLTRLYETDDQYPSPTDFVGSVHNAAAGQIALHFQATGANITTSGGDYSFEQALMTADLLTRDAHASVFVIGVDESHPDLSRLFDRSVGTDEVLSDGGGAFCLKRVHPVAGMFIHLRFYENFQNNPDVIAALVRKLGGPLQINIAYGLLLVGIPGGCRKKGQSQLTTFLRSASFESPVIQYRRITGEFASASAVAAVIASKFLIEGKIPGPLLNGQCHQLHGKGVLILNLGEYITAMELFKR